MATIDKTDTSLALLLDWTRMRLLIEIDRRGSVSAAAQQVGIGQPTASTHLRTLEAAAGQRLIERSGRGSKLTQAGRILATHAAQALLTLEAGEEELRALSGLQGGTIHLGASSTPGIYLLPDTLGCFRDDYPNVAVEVEIASTGEILERLLTGSVQLAIVGQKSTNERIHTEPFLDDEVIGIAAPGTLTIENGTIEPGQIAEHTQLVRERTSSTRHIADAALARAEVVPDRVWELDSSEAIKRAARAGLGISFLSHHAVVEEVERGDLESFRLAGVPHMTRSLYTARLAQRPLTPGEKGFLETLTRCCSKNAQYAQACVA
jgi:molybdate transport repressor ModE-like protein